VPKAHKKSAVARNAVAGGTETQKEDKEAFLEKRWDRIVEIGRHRKGPQSFDDLRGGWSGHKKVGHQPEALCHLLMERTLILRVFRHFNDDLRNFPDGSINVSALGTHEGE
jgi:hypothetical protein